MFVQARLATRRQRRAGARDGPAAAKSPTGTPKHTICAAPSAQGRCADCHGLRRTRKVDLDHAGDERGTQYELPCRYYHADVMSILRARVGVAEDTLDRRAAQCIRLRWMSSSLPRARTMLAISVPDSPAPSARCCLMPATICARARASHLAIVARWTRYVAAR